MMFELQTFPAQDGDCLILTWGEPGAPKRMLIDGGREGCWPSLKAALLGLPKAERVFELLVVTHIDADHIAGTLKMLADPARPVRFKEIWFNAYKHLPPPPPDEVFGGVQGEKLSDLLEAAPRLWNTRFGHKAVVVDNPAAPPRLDIAGLELTLLSPTREKLKKLEPVWRAEVAAEKLGRNDTPDPDPAEPTEIPPDEEVFGRLPDVAALAAEPLPRDTKAPNGSSIAFIARYGDRSVLLTGDAHADITEAALRHLPGEQRVFDLVKLSHHGSRGNLSAGLVEAWTTDHFVISTNGSHHKHPDAQTIARLIRAKLGPKTFYFNHRHEQAAIWDSADLQRDHEYRAVYPTTPGRLTIDIMALPGSAPSD
jgi:hypothetical protein